jgi:hypothetical protein
MVSLTDQSTGYRRKKEHGDCISAVVKQGFGVVEELRNEWARQIQRAIKGELQGSVTDQYECEWHD